MDGSDEKSVKGLSLEEFVKESVADLIGKSGAILEKAQDVVLYGFGRIGRLLTRMLIEDSAGGDNLRLRAIVVRKAIDDDIIKRANLMRTDSVHGPFKGTIRVVEEEDLLIINGNEVKFIYSNDPTTINYTEYGIENALLIDNTGVWRTKEGLRKCKVRIRKEKIPGVGDKFASRCGQKGMCGAVLPS